MLVREAEYQVETIVAEQFQQQVEHAIGKIIFSNWEKAALGLMAILTTKLAHSVIQRKVKDRSNGK